MHVYDYELGRQGRFIQTAHGPPREEGPHELGHGRLTPQAECIEYPHRSGYKTVLDL